MECRWWDSGEGRTTLFHEGSKQAAQSLPVWSEKTSYAHSYLCACLKDSPSFLQYPGPQDWVTDPANQIDKKNLSVRRDIGGNMETANRPKEGGRSTI
jgi:hypothetical protein